MSDLPEPVNLINQHLGLIDKPCNDCGTTVFYVGALSELCTLCIDRRARMARHVDNDELMTPRTIKETK